MDEAKLKEELLQCIQTKALKKGDFTLASGKKASFYIDGKQVTLDPQGLFLTGKFILSLLHGANADAIGGPTIGADPIAAAVSLLSSQTGHPLKAFLVRKAAKDHGTQRLIEGPPLLEGDRVVMVEDVITTGGSVLQAIQEVEKTKARVIRVLCLVDRNQGARELLAPYNYTPIFELSDLGVG
jgi:orotate phosphoribosyltransferase